MSVAEDVRPAPLLYEVRESGVAIPTFNRPERMNSWGGAMVSEFYRHIDLAAADHGLDAADLAFDAGQALEHGVLLLGVGGSHLRAPGGGAG